MKNTLSNIFSNLTKIKLVCCLFFFHPTYTHTHTHHFLHNPLIDQKIFNKFLNPPWEFTFSYEYFTYSQTLYATNIKIPYSLDAYFVLRIKLYWIFYIKIIGMLPWVSIDGLYRKKIYSCGIQQLFMNKQTNIKWYTTIVQLLLFSFALQNM